MKNDCVKLTTAAALALLCLAGCQREEPKSDGGDPKVADGKISFPAQSPQMAGLAVETANAHASGQITLTGRLMWNDDCTVRVFSPVAGRVQNISAQLSGKVSEGDLLAKIASPDFGQAQADALKAQADLQQAERTLARVRELFAHGAAAQKDMEGAEADQMRAVSEKDRTDARLKLYGGTATTSVDQMYPLRAPLGGSIVEKNINPGQEVRPDQMMANVPQFANPLFVISDPSKLWLQLDVSESDMGTLKIGQTLSIESRAFPGKKFTGRIEVMGDSIDPTTRYIKVRAAVDNPEKLLKAEMFVNVTAAVAADPAAASVVVPKGAVFLRENLHYIFVEESPGNYSRHAVRVGSEQDGRVEITEGLSAGQKVVTDGCLLLQSVLDGAS